VDRKVYVPWENAQTGRQVRGASLTKGLTNAEEGGSGFIQGERQRKFYAPDSHVSRPSKKGKPIRWRGTEAMKIWGDWGRGEKGPREGVETSKNPNSFGPFVR